MNSKWPDAGGCDDGDSDGADGDGGDSDGGDGDGVDGDGGDGDGGDGDGGGGGDDDWQRGLMECMQYEKFASFCNSILHTVTPT